MKKFIALFIALVFCIVPCSALVLSAAQPSSGSDVLDDTRYSAIGFGTIFEIEEVLNDISGGELHKVIPDGSKLVKFASEVAKNAFSELDGKEEGYVIKDVYSAIAKRKIVYPINGYEEVQYLFVYVNNNTGAQVQQFGDYTVAPNSIFMVRQTNFSGTLAYSIPIAENSITVSWGSSSKPCVISFPANSNFKMYTSEGVETFLVSSSSQNGWSVSLENNTYNTIVNDHLQSIYDYNPSDHRWYNIYLPNGTMDAFEAFCGVGYAAEQYENTSKWNGSYGVPDGTYPWYVTGFFSNNDLGTGSPSYYSTNNNINPSKPPGFILPSTNPFYSGKTIDNSTINNYNDYGVSITNNSLEIDPDILAGALAGLIDPDFGAAVGGVFSAQPEIGLGFDTPLDLNLPDLVDDYLQSITVYPPSEGWEPPSYPAVNTSTYIPATVPSYETYAIRTIPAADLDGTGDWFFFGFDLMDDLGFLVYFIPLAILGLFWRFTGGD